MFPLPNSTEYCIWQVNVAVRFRANSRQVFETCPRLFTDYHVLGLGGFTQANARTIVWKRTKTICTTRF